MTKKFLKPFLASQADYHRAKAVRLTRASDDVILAEIASWQWIFGTKKMSVAV